MISPHTLRYCGSNVKICDVSQQRSTATIEGHETNMRGPHETYVDSLTGFSRPFIHSIASIKFSYALREQASGHSELTYVTCLLCLQQNGNKIHPKRPFSCHLWSQPCAESHRGPFVSPIGEFALGIEYCRKGGDGNRDGCPHRDVYPCCIDREVDEGDK